MSVEKKYKTFSNFISQGINTGISLVKIVIRLGFRSCLPETEEKTCIVLGNGPSLNQSFHNHFDFFKKYSLICVNNFSITDEYIQLKPRYYVMLDPGLWSGVGASENNTINCIQTKTTWELYLLVPHIAKSSILFQQLEKANANVKVTYFNYTVFKGFKNIAHVFYKMNLAMPQSQNVLVATLFLSINIGFKKVYLVGADHSWHEHLHVNNENVVCVKHIYFYNGEENIAHVPFYKGAHRRNEVFTMDEILAVWSKAFYGYIALNKYAESCNCQVFNASEISYIDAFKRVKLQE